MENTYVGKFLKGKQIVDVSSDSKFVNFYFEDGSYDVAPIIDGVVKVIFDEEVVSQETDYVDMEGNTVDVPNLTDDEEEPLVDTVTGTVDDGEEIELGFYKTLEAIPFTNEEGEEIGKTEIGSIQEVPVALGDFWVANGMADKVEQTTE